VRDEELVDGGAALAETPFTWADEKAHHDKLSGPVG
jgi:hypothetical protein